MGGPEIKQNAKKNVRFEQAAVGKTSVKRFAKQHT
jgi:hypothetical protein